MRTKTKRSKVTVNQLRPHCQICSLVRPVDQRVGQKTSQRPPRAHPGLGPGEHCGRPFPGDRAGEEPEVAAGGESWGGGVVEGLCGEGD